jgi:HAMP domain-containing protein
MPAGVPENDRDRTRDPVVFLTGVLIVVWAALTFLAWRSYSNNTRERSVLEQELKAEELRGGITHMDEVLTMSTQSTAARRHPPEELAAIRISPRQPSAILTWLFVTKRETRLMLCLATVPVSIARPMSACETRRHPIAPKTICAKVLAWDSRRRLQALTTHATTLRRNTGSSFRIEFSTRFIGKEPFCL